MVKFSLIGAFLKKSRIIGINGRLPWKYLKEDMYHFKKITKGKIVISGRYTFKSMNYSGIKDRPTIVVSNKLKDEQEEGKFPVYLNDEIIIVRNIKDAVNECINKDKDGVFIGGNKIYEEGMNYSDKIYISEIYMNEFPHIHSDTLSYFPHIPKNKFIIEEDKTKSILTYERIKINKKTTLNGRLVIIEFKEYKRVYHEIQYLNMIKDILKNGYLCESANTIFNIGYTLKFPLYSKYFNKAIIPLLTTKKVFWKGIVEELLWFLRGETDSKLLEDISVNIWKDNSSSDYLKNKGLPYKEGILGPIYGYQWRYWGAEYPETINGIDQIKRVIKSIKKNPFSRRHIVSAWNVKDIDKMALPPCHIIFQFHVIPDKDGVPKYLSLQLYQRSGDVGLGIPFNIASYSLLTHIIGKEVGLIPYEFIHNLGNAHIYKEHINALKEQIKKEPYMQPEIRIIRDKNLYEYSFSDFKLIKYKYHPVIKMKMLV